jgi:hypothetical protein
MDITADAGPKEVAVSEAGSGVVRETVVASVVSSEPVQPRDRGMEETNKIPEKPAGNPAPVISVSGGENAKELVRPVDLSGKTDMTVVEEANSAAMHDLNEQSAAVTDRICRHIKAMTMDMVNNGHVIKLYLPNGYTASCPCIVFTSDMLEKDTDMRVYETDLEPMKKVILAAARAHLGDRGVGVDLKIKDGVHIPFLMSPHGHVKVSVYNANWREEMRSVRVYYKEEPVDAEAVKYLRVVEGVCQKKVRNLDEESAAKNKNLKK